MSTRSQIGFYDNAKTKVSEPDLLIYRHSDGYPGTADGKEYGVLADIIPFLKSFRQYRGNDTEYCGAQLLHHLMKGYDESTERMRKQYPKSFGSDSAPSYTGHGICAHRNFHGDIEYYYAVYPDEVRVFEVTGDSPDGWKKIKTVRIASKERAEQFSQCPLKVGRPDLIV